MPCPRHGAGCGVKQQPWDLGGGGVDPVAPSMDSQTPGSQGQSWCLFPGSPGRVAWTLRDRCWAPYPRPEVWSSTWPLLVAKKSFKFLVVFP